MTSDTSSRRSRSPSDPAELSIEQAPRSTPGSCVVPTGWGARERVAAMPSRARARGHLHPRDREAKSGTPGADVRGLVQPAPLAHARAMQKARGQVGWLRVSASGRDVASDARGATEASGCSRERRCAE
jgi:hypothetical protein